MVRLLSSFIMIFKSLCRHAGIGANSYLLKSGKAKVVLDAGMHPKHEGSEAIPHYEFLAAGSADSIIITHSHLDHVGTLPVFLQGQPQAKVFLSAETAELAGAMLHNSVNVMQAKRIEHGIAEYPLFEHRELDDIEEAFEVRGIERPFDMDPKGVFRGTFHDAGHILGSVGVTIEAEGKRIFYTGDVNFEHSTLQKGALFPEEKVDVLIVETTRGEQARDPGYNRQDEENALADAIRKVLEEKGFGTDSGVRDGQDAGGVRNAAPFQGGGSGAQEHAGLYRRVEHEDDAGLRSLQHDIATPSSKFPVSQGHGTGGRKQKAQGADPLPSRLHLCSIKRDDVGENRF